jgi:hypothetical protein
VNRKQIFGFSLGGLGLGLGMGLLISWLLVPVQFIDTTPASLRVDFKDEYRFMIASAYASNFDLLRAQARLDTLADPDSLSALGEQAQRMMAGNSPVADIQTLAGLSTALEKAGTSGNNPTNTITPGITPTSLESATPTSGTPASPTTTATSFFNITPFATPFPTAEPSLTPEQKPISTLPPRPTQTPSPTPSQPFTLVKQVTFCESDQPGQLQINLTDSAGKPAAGIELVVAWVSGEDHFFTGLKPELGYGYADFTMTENIEYALSLPAGGTRVTGLSTSQCTDSQGNEFPGGIHLEFKQP